MYLNTVRPVETLPVQFLHYGRVESILYRKLHMNHADLGVLGPGAPLVTLLELLPVIASLINTTVRTLQQAVKRAFRHLGRHGNGKHNATHEQASPT